eukprot:CAMPEP_0119152200 /NCGR_PEP_ID=MMETSP1310-20130426/47403_1 /TAXON_ID=464262 /ORGANISM="Genus nov. species nov., Strain RCC2339" /LENGTH=317 /DNA_ID=CAMNT_0007144541 /DNA_START=51 /DNA_END=1004 /DNA_ORIENTATION=-
MKYTERWKWNSVVVVTVVAMAMLGRSRTGVYGIFQRQRDASPLGQRAVPRSSMGDSGYDPDAGLTRSAHRYGFRRELAVREGRGGTSSPLDHICGLVRASWQKTYSFISPSYTSGRSNESLIIVGSQGTTGTRSIYKALNLAGKTGFHFDDDQRDKATWLRIKTYHFEGKDTDALLRYLDYIGSFQVAADSPMPEWAPLLLRRFPNAKLLLSWRDFQEWERSRNRNHPPGYAPFYPLIDVYTSPATHLSHRNSVANFQLYSSQLLLLSCLFPPDRILIVDMFDNPSYCQSAWPDLLRFLSLPADVASVRALGPFPGC